MENKKEPYRYGTGIIICQEYQDCIEEMAAHASLLSMFLTLPEDLKMALAGENNHFTNNIDINFSQQASKEMLKRSGIRATHMGACKTALEIIAREQYGDLRNLKDIQ